MKRTFIVAAIAVCVFLFPSAGSVQAQYPTPTPACGCTVDGNCYGQGCTTGDVLRCEVQCDPNYRNVEMWCGPVDTGLYCGGKCIYEQTCVTGYCQGEGCGDVEGDFLCGSGGCNACQRFVKETICDSNHCQSWCSNDATCGVGCDGGPGGATNTPQPPGPTNTPGPSPTPTAGPSPTPTSAPAGTIRARAVQVNPADTSCTAIRAVPTTNGQIDGTTLRFTLGSASHPATQTKAGANYVIFPDIDIGSIPSLPILRLRSGHMCVRAGTIKRPVLPAKG